MTNSTFSGNSGAGAINNNGGTLTVTSSTFSGNTGGAILNSGTLIVTNSTFSGNQMAFGRAAIENDYGTVTVTDATFSGNSGDDTSSIGAAITNNGGTVTVTNSIVANGISGSNCSGTITDGGHNIDDGTTCGFTGTNCASTTGTSFCNTNPLLDPAGLANNGGPTDTIALQAGSPSINAGDETVCTAAPVSNLDQRGGSRPGVGAMDCSIGAYEFNAILPATTTTTSTTTSTTLPSCGSAPVSGCQPAGTAKATVLLGNGKLKWKWIGSGAVATADFGNPTTITDYLFCLYEATGEKLSARMPADRTCGRRPCWSALGTMGFEYADKAGTPGGVTKARLKAGGAGVGRISVNGAGTNLHLPTLPLITPVRVQLRQSASSTCWDATYSIAIRNDTSEFKARSE